MFRLPTVAVAVVLLLPSLGASAPDREELFSSYSPLDVSLKAPLDDLFAAAQMDPEYTVSGTVSYKDASAGKEITIDNVERRNCYDPPMRLQLAHYLDECADDDNIKVVLLRGEGGIFSTGADMANAYSWYETEQNGDGRKRLREALAQRARASRDLYAQFR